MKKAAMEIKSKLKLVKDMKDKTKNNKRMDDLEDDGQ